MDINYQTTCLYCKKDFNHLGSHLWQTHKIKSRDYKEEFSLPYTMPLISEEVKAKKQEAFQQDKDKYLKNLENSEKYQFKKGRTGQRRISQHERKTIMKRILEVNERKKIAEKCPVCNMKFHHVESHLLLKHKLLKVE